MNINMRVFLGLLFMLIIQSCVHKDDMTTIVDNALDLASRQSLLMAEQYSKYEGVLPRSYENNKSTHSGPEWWTSGFFPGTLWYLYENGNDTTMLKYARLFTSRVENEQYTTDNHDIGFMIFCSFGNGYRLTKDSCYKKVILTAASSLSKRFNPNVGLIRSWDFNKDQWQYPVIIDNMMNLEMLMWASKNGGEKRYADISVSHADNTIKNHYRTDNSCYHVVSYDTITGLPHIKQTNQGFDDNSSWARGQVWGLYGYTMMYRETRNKKYLLMAQKIAEYLINHHNMSEDLIPYWDFDAPNIPDEPRDASSAAIMASALIELSDYSDKQLAELYMNTAEKQLRTLATDKYTASIGSNGNFILKHSTGNYPIKSEIDAPLTYADYYYVEALIRYKRKIYNGKSL